MLNHPHEGRLLSRPRLIDAGALTASPLAGSAFGLLATVIAARALGPGRYGLVALAITYPALLRSMTGLKTTSVTTRYLVRFRAADQVDAMRAATKLGYLTDVATATAAAIVAASLAPIVAPVVLKQPDLVGPIIVYTFSFPFAALAGNSAGVLDTFGRFRMLSALQLAESAISAALIIGAVWGGLGVAGVVGATALGEAVGGVAHAGMAGVTLRKVNASDWWRGRLDALGHHRNEILRNFGWNFGVVTAAGATDRAPVIIVGALVGPAASGYLRIATSVVGVAGYLEAALRRMVYPRLAGLWEGPSRHAIDRQLKRWAISIGAPLGALLGLSTLAVPMLVRLVFGHQYAPMSRGLQWMLLSAALTLPMFWREAAIFAAGRFRFMAVAMAVYTGAFLGSVAAASAVWGFLGAAVVFAVGRVSMAAFVSAAAMRSATR